MIPKDKLTEAVEQVKNERLSLAELLMPLKKLFVPYELSLKLKEKGYNEVCMARYDKIDNTNPSTDEDNRKLELFVLGESENPLSWTICNAPTYQQAINWLLHLFDFQYPYISIQYYDDGSGNWYSPADNGYEALDIDFDNLDEAIEKALELL